MDHSIVSRRRFVTGAGTAALAGAAAATSLSLPAATPRPAVRAALPGSVARALSAKTGADHAEVPPFAVMVLHRMGFGPARRTKSAPRPAPAGQIFGEGFEPAGEPGKDDIGHFQSLGRTDEERLANYVEEQLDPQLPDPELASRMAQHAAAFSLLDDSTADTWSVLECQGFTEYARPYREVERAAFTRAVYSRRQLFELMADFWHNHFNIYAPLDRPTLVTWQSWDRDIIRRHAFGNFFEMLWDSARHPAMLRYLDNYVNRDGGINENYARELFELHTLGAEHYRGLEDPATIEALPVNPYSTLATPDPDLTSAALGNIASRTIARYFVDYDVYSAADALTGFRYQNNSNDAPPQCGTGAFTPRVDQHDGGAKAILSRNVNVIPANLDPETEGRLVCKMAAYHPSTATYIARKLCIRLISDQPPQSVVDKAADAFMAHRQSPDQMAHVLRAILLSSEFRDAPWGQKTKRPFEYVVSAMRAAGCRHTWRMDDRTSDDFLYVYNAAGHRLFNWRTPDGFPDERRHWQGSTSLVQSWRCIDWLVDRDASDDALRVMQVRDITLANLAGNPTPRQIVEFWCEWILGFSPAGGWTGSGTHQDAPTRIGGVALQFFSQQGYLGAADRNPWGYDDPIPRANLSQNSGGYDWDLRLRGLVAMVLWSPNFMQR